MRKKVIALRKRLNYRLKESGANIFNGMQQQTDGSSVAPAQWHL
jgi:hypothetical protein